MDANPTSVTQSVAQTGEAQTLQTLNDQPQATAEIIETPVTVDSAASIKIKTEQPAKQGKARLHMLHNYVVGHLDFGLGRLNFLVMKIGKCRPLTEHPICSPG